MLGNDLENHGQLTPLDGFNSDMELANAFKRLKKKNRSKDLKAYVKKEWKK